jgi:hypothetical protein
MRRTIGAGVDRRRVCRHCRVRSAARRRCRDHPPKRGTSKGVCRCRERDRQPDRDCQDVQHRRLRASCGHGHRAGHADGHPGPQPDRAAIGYSGRIFAGHPKYPLPFRGSSVLWQSTGCHERFRYRLYESGAHRCHHARSGSGHERFYTQGSAAHVYRGCRQPLCRSFRVSGDPPG